MREIRTSGLTSGDGKRSVAAWPKPPRPSSTLQIRGKKRHVMVDTEGLLLQAIVHAADIQDREGGVLLMATLFGLYPFLLKLYADGGYQGPQFQGGLRRIMCHVDVEIVKRSDRMDARRRNASALRFASSPSISCSRNMSQLGSIASWKSEATTSMDGAASNTMKAA